MGIGWIFQKNTRKVADEDSPQAILSALLKRDHVRRDLWRQIRAMAIMGVVTCGALTYGFRDLSPPSAAENGNKPKAAFSLAGAVSKNTYARSALAGSAGFVLATLLVQGLTLLSIAGTEADRRQSVSRAEENALVLKKPENP